MFITDILYFNKEDSEAEVSVSDGRYTVNCYAYPCDRVFIKQRINTIYGFECKNIIRLNEAKYVIRKLSQHYAYQLVAQVVDNENGVVRIGDLFINLDNSIPKDIVNGEYITFSVLRLDCDCKTGDGSASLKQNR